MMGRFSILFTFCIMLASINMCRGANTCYAPPLFWGGTCSSSTSIFGRPGHKVRYSVTVNGNAGTLVCCQGLNPESGKYVSIGCGHSSFSGDVNWGNSLATPKIKCKGTPFGASVTWSH